jgi:L-ribulose-5-phosphate 3-epimerase UlaE
LEGLEDAYREAVEQRAEDNVSFANEPPLLEMWSRDKVEDVLKELRTAKKQTTPGWDEIK